MQLDVQWFLKTLVDNSIMTVERGVQINNALGGEPDLMQYAQEVLNELCAGMSPEDARNWASQLEQVIAFAQQQAATGQAPDLGTAPDRYFCCSRYTIKPIYRPESKNYRV